MATSDCSDKRIRIGVLIIGSLYWDDKEHRKEWRRDRLDPDNKKHVRAPIRYGRLSRSRGCTYAMVFSKQLDTPGTLHRCRAIVVPCKALVNSVDDVVTEAQHLWQAEQAERGKERRISAKWGCVALLEHPKRPMPDNMRAGWTKYVQRKQRYGALNSARGEPSVVDEEGFLTISWPRTEDDSDLAVDVLLATATDPTLIRGDYPSAQEIAAAWNAHEGEDYKCYVQYFNKNREHRIRTFQDDDIKKFLRAP